MLSLHIVKIGGNVIDNSENLHHFLKDFTALDGYKILVHGGGKVATQLSETLGIEAKLVDGRRITDIETLRVVTMVYGGLINKNMVAQLQRFGNNAIGLTGADGNFIRTKKRPVKTIDYGFVGDIDEKSINPENIGRLMEAGFTPVFCAITHDGEGQLLNTNADTIASALAVALAKLYAVTLIYCFEKKGVLQDIDDEDSIIRELDPLRYEELKQKQIIHSGMLPKLDNAFTAIACGVKAVVIGRSDDLGQLKKKTAFRHPFKQKFMNAQQHIAILGAGNIGLSLAKGLVKAGICKPQQITLTRRNTDALANYANDGYQVIANNIKAVKRADIIVIAVLPQQLDKLLEEIKPAAFEKQLFISVVSGVDCADIRTQLAMNVQVIRAMPNTAIAIGESMTCIATDNSTPKNITLVRSLFDTVGLTIQINEELMTAATALCACGVAFFLRSIRAASQGGTEIGFHAHDALKMAAQTAKGAANLLLQLHSHPEQEIDKVTSPKGCTIAGLNEMEHNGFSSAMIKGIKLSAEKAGDLYKG